MEYIQRLPFILSISMTLITGFLTRIYGQNLAQSSAYMLCCFLLFYLLGKILSKTLTNITDEIKQKEENKSLDSMYMNEGVKLEISNGYKDKAQNQQNEEGHEDFKPMEFEKIEK